MVYMAQIFTPNTPPSSKEILNAFNKEFKNTIKNSPLRQGKVYRLEAGQEAVFDSFQPTIVSKVNGNFDVESFDKIMSHSWRVRCDTHILAVTQKFISSYLFEAPQSVAKLMTKKIFHVEENYFKSLWEKITFVKEADVKRVKEFFKNIGKGDVVVMAEETKPDPKDCLTAIRQDLQCTWKTSHINPRYSEVAIWEEVGLIFPFTGDSDGI